MDYKTIQPSAILNEIQLAESRIRPYTLTTPLIESRELSRLIEGKVYLKLESEQYTGSFKARGSLNKVLSLSEVEKAKGVVTASTGNHALGVARALELTGVRGTIFLPETASPAKVKALETYPVELKFHGRDSLATELHAKAIAEREGVIWISPYDDPQIIGGQGTIGRELCDQLEAFDYAFITIGGGGLISGIGTYLKARHPSVQVIGCQPENSPEMTLSLEKGEIVYLEEPLETLSDGSAGGMEEGAITFPICQQVVDRCLLVSEAAIADALRFMVYTHHKIIEGAAAVPIACLQKNAEHFRGSTVVIVLCGANIDGKKLKEIL